jgi:hypothetical protein
MQNNNSSRTTDLKHLFTRRRKQPPKESFRLARSSRHADVLSITQTMKKWIFSETNSGENYNVIQQLH